MTSNNPSFISSEIKLGFLKYPDRGYLMNSSKDFHKNLARDFFVNSFGDSFYDFCKNPFRNFARNSNWNLCRNLDSLIRYYSSIPRIHSGISSRVSSKIKLFHGFFGNFYKILKKPIDLVYFFLEGGFYEEQNSSHSGRVSHKLICGASSTLSESNKPWWARFLSNFTYMFFRIFRN